MKGQREKREIIRSITLPDIILICAIGALALMLFAWFYVKGRNAEKLADKMLIITADGVRAGSYPLDEDRTIEVGRGNVCEIKEGRVFMRSADCPDQSCVHSYPIDRGGQAIVCLPNKVVLEINEGGSKTDEGLDSVVY